jgi:hypothetical protein
MKRLLLLPIATLAVVGITGCDDVQSPAVTVDGTDISQSSVDDELHALRDNDALAAALAESEEPLARSPGTINSMYASGWLTNIIVGEVVSQQVDARDIAITDAQRDDARAQAPNAFPAPEVFDEFPEWFRDRFIDRVAEITALGEALGDQAALTELIQTASVDVDARYGTWSADEGRVVPPTRE